MENTSEQVQLEQATVAQYQGRRRRTRYTGGVTVMRGVAVPFMWQITQQPATICFQNGGFITPESRHLVVELADAGSGNRINFEWELDSSVAAPRQ